MRTYICLYRGKKIIVAANTTMEAQTIAAKQVKAKKQWEISVYLADSPIDPASL